MTPELARGLANFKGKSLHLRGVKKLKKGVLQSLLAFEGEINLSNVKVLRDEDMVYLAKHPSAQSKIILDKTLQSHIQQQREKESFSSHFDKEK